MTRAELFLYLNSSRSFGELIERSDALADLIEDSSLTVLPGDHDFTVVATPRMALRHCRPPSA